MRTILVVNDIAVAPVVEGVEVIAARDYLADPRWAELRSCRVLNLCRSFRYQKSGYYVSLLAHARGHRPVPTLAAIQGAKSAAIVGLVSDELHETIQRSLAPEEGPRVTLTVCMGVESSGRHQGLAAALFGHVPLPLLQATFTRHERSGEWSLSRCTSLPIDRLPESAREQLGELIGRFLRRRRSSPRRDESCYDLAILRDPAEAEPPSNEGALRLLQKAAQAEGLSVELITRDDYARVAEFDALFIRETTAVNHHTFRFSQRAAAEGLVVLDDPESILRCSNKVYLAELLGRHGIRTPRTMIVHRGNLGPVAATMGFPCVLKQPDSAFSQGVTKVTGPEDFREQATRLLRRSDLLVVQAFMPTEFDWRVGVLDQRPLFVCKYYMAAQHWQVMRHRDDGRPADEGTTEAVPFDQTPPAVLEAAVRAANLMGDGLYGVDLKEVDGKPYVIEVNDNPNLYAGTEDELLGEGLYRTIMAEFRRRLDVRRQRGSPR
ncbi:RimK family protein [Paraliomyxa miuraensis]|uniref:RimK family protein n=1 Tax=Paraliomyxa miuraensis TaxID=376150 RepID=UPI00224EDA95|nr:RimK family protein [Paraliomyxa miuraensis]MCX4246091.1 RimK family protein [Paraliomyxa miuraensis]